MAGAPARQQRLVDPAFGAVGIAHAPPVVEFLDDLHRQAGLQIHPVDRIVDAGSDARVDAARFQADETRQRQAARPDRDALRIVAATLGRGHRAGNRGAGSRAMLRRRPVEATRNQTLSFLSALAACGRSAPPFSLSSAAAACYRVTGSRDRLPVSLVLVKEVSTRSAVRGNNGRQEKASRRHHAQAARPGRDPHARAVRRAAERRRQADDAAGTGCGGQGSRRSGADHHRSHRRRFDRPHPPAHREAHRPVRQRLRQYRHRCRLCG